MTGKKVKVHPEDKKYFNLMKLLISSLSMRMCNYAYFNIVPNGFILSNSTKPAMNKGATKTKKGSATITPHDRLLEYCDSDLTLHFVELKDPAFLNKFKTMLGIPNNDEVWCSPVTNVNSIVRLDNLHNLTLTPGFGESKLLSQTGVPYSELTKKNVSAFPVKSFQVAKTLYDWWIGVDSTDKDEFKTKTQHVSFPLDPNKFNIVDRGYSIKFDLDNLVDNDGSSMFTNSISNLNIECIDGIDAVSVKEFIKKVQETPYTLDMLIWAFADTYILYMTRFENDVVRVRTLRPNILLIPLTADTPIIHKDLLNMENINGL